VKNKTASILDKQKRIINKTKKVVQSKCLDWTTFALG